MTRCGMTLEDVPRRVGWAALRSFVAHLGPDSALYAEQHPGEGDWYAPWNASAVLADIYDALAALTVGYATANRKKGAPKPKQPKPYPRPWLTDEQMGIRRVGRGAIPIRDFDKWWEG